MTPYYEHAGTTIYHGDCRDVVGHISTFDCVITDPPYGVNLKGKTTLRGGAKTVFRPGIYSFDDTPEYIESVVVPVLTPLVEKAKAAAVFPGTRNMWAYPKPTHVAGVYTNNGAGMTAWGFRCFEPVLFYGSDPYLRTRQGSRPDTFAATGGMYKVNDIDHPCPKPLEWMLWLVNRASLPGETILDPFMGSGTTLVAAKQLNRKAIGIELEERYCEIAARRLQQEVFDLVGEA